MVHDCFGLGCIIIGDKLTTKEGPTPDLAVVDEVIINCYNTYIENDDSDEIFSDSANGKVKLSNKMGYLSSVNEARKKLEDIFKDHKES